MKTQVKEMFEQVKMPETTAKRIEATMQAKPRKRRNMWAGKLAAAAAMLTLVLSLSPEVRAAVDTLITKYVFPDSGLTLYRETNEQGDVMRIMAVDTLADSFAQLRDGRLWFSANGEEIDITEKIGEDKPFYYTYTDGSGFIHYMAVAYSGSLENFGIYEFMKEMKDDQEKWVTGTGRNFLNPETEERYPWVDLVWEEFDVPWPMPGT